MDKQLDHWLIVTDLDGTLLNHHDYSFKEALSTLEKLEAHGIPVIINSSKTAAEIEQLRRELNNQTPFIVENGSGVLIPKTYFKQRPDGAEEYGDYWEVILGKPRAELLAGLNQMPALFKNCYQSYSDSTVDDVMLMTGLSRSEATASMDRRYTEPLKWSDSSATKLEFFDVLRKRHLHHTEGGRFIHLMGQTNKGSAMTWLARHHAKQYKKNIRIVALGDANNDIDMFTAADIAAVIKSPVNPPPEFDHNHKIMSTQTGAAGWAEVIESIFFKKQ